MKTEIMTLEQFLNEYRDKSALEELAERVYKNKTLKSMAVFVIASLTYAEKVLAADTTVEAVKRLNTAGNTLLSVMQTIGYWVALLMCIIEILKTLSSGDTKSIGRIIVKYLMAFAGIYVLKWLFDLIRVIFGG